MHVSDAVLAAPLVAGGWAVTGVTTALCLRGVREERIPHAAVLTACFFVASTIHVPLGFAKIHLVLNGLCGVILGPLAFPAILIGLLLQALLFGHGGLAILGFNAYAMGLPALVAWGGMRIWRRCRWGRAGIGLLVGAFSAGGGAVVLGAALVAGGLVLSGKTLEKLAPWFFLSHVVLGIIEGIVTAGTVRFLSRVEPKLLEG